MAQRAMGDDVAQFTLAEAAKSVGKSKSTVLRSIQAGRLSAARDELTGGWTIDVAELHRVYPAMREVVHGASNGEARNGDIVARISELEARLAEKNERLADARDQIADLRRQRDAEAEERRRLTALLADQRATPPVRRSWWPWRR